MRASQELLAEARAHDMAGRAADAERLCREVLARDANLVDARMLLALVCHRARRFDEVIDQLEHVLRLNPNHALALHMLGATLGQQGKTEAAIASLSRAVALEPQMPGLQNNLRRLEAVRLSAEGRSLGQSGRLAEAEACFRRALELDPQSVEGLSGLGIALTRQGNLQEGELLCRRVVAMAPQLADAHYAMTIPLVKQNRLDEALACFRQAIAMQPDNVEYHKHYGLTLLLAGQYGEGWAEYEWRWKEPGRVAASLNRPTWRGEPLDGRTIVLATEQGFGDAIHLVRYADLVKQRGGTVVVECQSPLATLLATCPGVDQVVVRGEPLPPYDLVVPFLNLPGIFGTTIDTIPARIPYLAPEASLVANWKERLGNDGLLRIGIAWRGSPIHASDRERSIPLSHFEGIVRTAGVRIYSLQFEPGSDQLEQSPVRESITHLAGQLRDFQDTAAVMCNLDLVITCDSAPAHLAGALGVPVWVAVQYAPDWRWLVKGETTRWYPSMRLFRQSGPFEWAPVFKRIEAALAELLEQRRRAG